MRPVPEGWRSIGPGVYVDEAETMHVRADEVCEYFGADPTEENQRRVEQGVRDAFGDAGGEIVVREHRW